MDKLPPGSVTFGQLKVCLAILQYEFGIDEGTAADDGGYVDVTVLFPCLLSSRNPP